MAQKLPVFNEHNGDNNYHIPIDSDDEDAVNCKRHIKYGTRYQAAWAIFSEYCNNSTIHGIKYIGEWRRSYWERFFWILIFVLSICVSTYFIVKIWGKWNENPVIVSFAEKSTPVWQIPFPAITICSETITNPALFNFTKVWWKYLKSKEDNSSESLSEDEENKLFTITQICDDYLVEEIPHNQSEITTAQLTQTLLELLPVFNKSNMECLWRNKLKDCSEVLKPILTDAGICYSFNDLKPNEIYRAEGLHPEFILFKDNRTSTEWNVENGYRNSPNTDTYPNRVLGHGYNAGLEVSLLGYSSELDNLCRGLVQGFKVVLSTPGEVPQISKDFIQVPFDQGVIIAIRPKIITTSDGLKGYEPYRRQCYFQKERFLRYFQIYTQSNCELECLANYTYSKCGCVKFSMPRCLYIIQDHKDMHVCGVSKKQCYILAEDEVLHKEFTEGLKTSGENYRGETECNCLPDCTSISYEAVTSQTNLDITSFMQAWNESSEGMKVSMVSIYFQEAQFLTSKRSELYGVTDFLANCGGLLGLFMGVSTFSIIEIVYFCTARLVTNLQMRRRKRRRCISHTAKDISKTI